MDNHLRLIDSTDAFKALKRDWNDLYEKSSRATIFSSWDWMYTWWETFNDQINTKLTILCLYEDDVLVGLAPFQVIKTYPNYLVQGWTLCFLGTGEAKQDSITSQYVDFIVQSGFESKMVDSVTQYLLENKHVWNFADFEFLLKGSLISQCFQSTSDKVTIKYTNYGYRFFIPEMDSVDSYKAQMKKRWRKMLNKKSRLIAEDGSPRIKAMYKPEQINAEFSQLAEMHNARWHERVGKSVFQSPLFHQFHLKIIERLLPQNKVFIKTLYKDDEALASYYGFMDKDQTHYYQSGFYSNHANRYSPLFLLVCNEIGEAIKQNICFDFMFSDQADSYKGEQYAANHTEMYRLKWSPQRSRFVAFNVAKAFQNTFLYINKFRIRN